MRSLKNRAQNIDCSLGYVARSAVLLEANVANILLFNFCEQKFVQHGPIMIAIDCNSLSLLIFEEKCPNYASGPKSAQNSGSFWIRRLFNVSKWASSEKKIFLAKISIFCKSIAGPLPNVVQAYTQPYSFGGRIKLIIWQIRHELSVTIHVLGASSFQCMLAGFLCPICNNFACLHNRQDRNELHLKRWFFFLRKSTSSVSRSQYIFVLRKDKTNYLSNQTWAKC